MHRDLREAARAARAALAFAAPDPTTAAAVGRRQLESDHAGAVQRLDAALARQRSGKGSFSEIRQARADLVELEAQLARLTSGRVVASAAR